MTREQGWPRTANAPDPSRLALRAVADHLDDEVRRETIRVRSEKTSPSCRSVIRAWSPLLIATINYIRTYYQLPAATLAEQAVLDAPVGGPSGGSMHVSRDPIGR